jgi:spermidine/putrescine-binding protein
VPQTDILATEEGVMEVVAKLAELRPNVRLWYRDEGQFQQALESGEIPMGQYYHDVTGLAAAQGQPVRSTFPQEGGVLDSGSWVVPRASAAVDEAQAFIDYMARPEVQARLALRRDGPHHPARSDGSHGRGIRRRRLRHAADPARLRPLSRPGRLG